MPKEGANKVVIMTSVNGNWSPHFNQVVISQHFVPQGRDNLLKKTQVEDFIEPNYTAGKVFMITADKLEVQVNVDRASDLHAIKIGSLT